MKKTVFTILITITSIISLQAQIYIPNGKPELSINNNVGIGTDNTIAKLTIQAGYNNYPTPLKAISIWGPNSPANSNSAQDISWDFSAAGSTAIRSYRGGYYDTYMEFLTSPPNGNNPQVRMHINGEGNIGIGTTDPTTKLDVYGTIKSYESTPLKTTPNSFQLINEIGGSTGSSNKMMNKKWLLRDATSDNWWTARLHDGISVDASYMNPHVDTKTWWERDPNDNIQSWGNAAETYLTINKGNVGIGTTNPTAKLTVAGDINSREVRVTVSAGADFVFENNYNLPSLTSVETFIKENKHLPEIASAKEMQENGINLSEMNIKLLQKIEELTLHMIEMKKENERIIKENEGFKSLSERLSKIEKQLK